MNEIDRERERERVERERERERENLKKCVRGISNNLTDLPTICLFH